MRLLIASFQRDPISFKGRFDVFEADNLDRFDPTERVAVVAAARVVVAHDAAIVAGMELMVHAGQV
ncbi:hypothetical protein [Thiomonas sp. FB-6]|uniref:hypothetical protein n=1 Tax=Thiomonas sp. FB-6 TaxID=1158291 RepID=UPI0012DBEE45|nr:hypothetical protein [Thiomonas sp. FB-6]